MKNDYHLPFLVAGPSVQQTSNYGMTGLKKAVDLSVAEFRKIVQVVPPLEQ